MAGQEMNDGTKIQKYGTSKISKKFLKNSSNAIR